MASNILNKGWINYFLHFEMSVLNRNMTVVFYFFALVFYSFLAFDNGISVWNFS